MRRPPAMALLASLFPRRTANCGLLRSLTDEVGGEVESWPARLLRRAAEERRPIAREADGIRISVQVEGNGEDPDGALRICIDSRSDLPTIMGIRPSCTFVRDPDDSIRD
jgi:hypothetical protein